MTDPLIRVGPLGGARLVQDYLAGRGAAGSFFHGPPGSIEIYRRKLGELQERFGPEARAGAAAALRPTSERAAERLTRFVEQGGFVVTTGQQTGLFTGPLYTIHKIAGAIALAEALEAALGALVLPVFWSASEDHDWEEVNHAWIADSRGRLRRLELAAEDARPIPMSERKIGTGIDCALDEVSQVLDSQEFTGPYLALLRDAYRPSRSMAKGFRAAAESIFSGFDLLTTDAADPALKLASAPVLEQALDTAAAQEATVRETSEALIEAGYHAQVSVIPRAANVFLHTREGRERLRRTPEGWRTRGSRKVWSLAELRAVLEAHPDQLSPNVLLRPIVESAVFPVLAYVAGPGEISYFAQISRLFGQYGMGPPVVYPRPSVTVIPEGVQIALHRLGLTEADLAAPESELSGVIARHAIPPELAASVEALRTSTAEGFRQLLEAIPDSDDPVERSIGALRNRTLSSLREVEHKLLTHAKRREAAMLEQVAAVRNVLRPLGQPQERVLNVIPFLAEYGPSLLDRIVGAARQAIPGDLAQGMRSD